ncbi:hypothetical protein B0H13DRAFT_2668453 [Mycena leptocephala]|nr:hypothetical protein B0H13DRAFT_2668453 [Mycena leptocephala]
MRSQDSVRRRTTPAGVPVASLILNAKTRKMEVGPQATQVTTPVKYAATQTAYPHISISPFHQPLA